MHKYWHSCICFTWYGHFWPGNHCDNCRFTSVTSTDSDCLLTHPENICSRILQTNLNYVGNFITIPFTIIVFKERKNWHRQYGFVKIPISLTYVLCMIMQSVFQFISYWLFLLRWRCFVRYLDLQLPTAIRAVVSSAFVCS